MKFIYFFIFLIGNSLWNLCLQYKSLLSMAFKQRILSRPDSTVWALSSSGSSRFPPSLACCPFPLNHLVSHCPTKIQRFLWKITWGGALSQDCFQMLHFHFSLSPYVLYVFCQLPIQWSLHSLPFYMATFWKAFSADRFQSGCSVHKSFLHLREAHSTHLGT